MSRGRFNIAFDLTIAEEGGKSNRVADRGGKTKYGITWRTLEEAVARKIVPAGTTVDTLTLDQAATIAFQLYWLPSKASELAAPFDILHFDAYYNHRPGDAIRILQRGLGVEDDGLIGPKTIAATKTASPWRINRYLAERAKFFAAIAANDDTQVANLAGWFTRLFNLHQSVIEGVA